MTSGNNTVIFAPASDLHAAAVHYGLVKNAVEPIWVPSVASSLAEMLSVQCSQRSGLTLGGSSSTAPMVSVWMRRLKRPRASKECHESDRQFVEGEWIYFQKNLISLSTELIKALWVNEPSAARQAESKLLQLHVARSIGLNFPDTLVSCNPAAVRSFIKCQGKVVVKTFLPHLWDVRETEALFGASPAVIASEKELEDESIRLCPSIYQKLVEKVCDIRITVIGDHIFAAKFTSSKGGALLDWRPSVFTSKLAAEPYQISKHLEQKIKLLMRELGLTFGCIDLAVDKQGDVNFLEINQEGQFLFVEKLLPSLPLLRAFCAMLTQGRSDYLFGSSSRVSLEEYENSDDYSEWCDKNKSFAAEGQEFVSVE